MRDLNNAGARFQLRLSTCVDSRMDTCVGCMWPTASDLFVTCFVS